MKEIIHNRDNLIEKDITEIVVRTKALIINNEKNNKKNHAITPNMIETIEIYRQTL